jgi:hypothetical protein
VWTVWLQVASAVINKVANQFCSDDRGDVMMGRVGPTEEQGTRCIWGNVLLAGTEMWDKATTCSEV